MRSFFLRTRQLQDLAKAHALPKIVEAAPTGYAVKVSGNFYPRQAIEVVPCQLQTRFDQTRDVEVPCGRIEARYGTIVQYRPFQGERLAGRQASSLLHLLLTLLALVTFEHFFLPAATILPTGGVQNARSFYIDTHQCVMYIDDGL